MAESSLDSLSLGAEAEPGEVPILYEQPLHNLRAVVPLDNFMSLVENWFTSLGGRMDLLSELAVAGEVGSLKRTAHDMAGTCGCFGALRLGELAWQLELACLAGDLSSARSLVDAMV